MITWLYRVKYAKALLFSKALVHIDLCKHICCSLTMTNYIKIVAPCVFGKDPCTAIANTNDTDIDSSAVKCGASAEVLCAPYQLQYTVLVWQVGQTLT